MKGRKKMTCLHFGTISSVMLLQFYLIWPSPFGMMIGFSICHNFVVQYYVNYKRWIASHCEDCLTLLEQFSDTQARFINCAFFISHSLRKGSVAPMDQALQKTCNKPAKSYFGIFDFKQGKESFSKWNLIKHQKTKYINFLFTTCQLEEDDKYILHYEFFEAITKSDQKSVGSLLKEIYGSVETLFIPRNQRKKQTSLHVPHQIMKSKLHLKLYILGERCQRRNL